MRKLERDLGRVVPYLFPHLEGRHRGERIQEFRKSWATACRKAGLASVETVKDGRRTVKKITAHLYNTTSGAPLCGTSSTWGVPEVVASPEDLKAASR